MGGGRLGVLLEEVYFQVEEDAPMMEDGPMWGKRRVRAWRISPRWPGGTYGERDGVPEEVRSRSP